MKVLTDEEVVDLAKKWARFHRNPKTRARMDECLEGISKADQRRVYLCGQRVACGMDPKVIPAPASNQQKGKENDRSKDRKSRQSNESD
jgi:hypothetical protein